MWVFQTLITIIILSESGEGLRRSGVTGGCGTGQTVNDCLK